MKLFAPKYYKNFACIADRCRHSCCVGWEIDVDEAAMKLYETADGYGAVIRNSIAAPSEEGEVPHFKLSHGERCPHLTERGLCRIITELGEGFLCHICREHPRFYNRTARGMEVGLGMACEEACRLILSSDEYCCMEAVGESDGEAGAFDAIPFRERVYEILADGRLSYGERLYLIYGEFGVTPHALSDEEWREVLASLEYLDEAHGSLFAEYTSFVCPSAEWEKPLERALAYFVYRHCSEAESAWEFCTSLGFCLFCERLLASMAEKVESFEEFCNRARILSEEIEYSEDNTEAIRFEAAPYDV